jgi:eukaryotic-like serine/threonine-protein kinase
MFANFHGRLNAHFEFLNQKAQTNRHFNAADSRELMALIEEIRSAQETLVLVDRGFKVTDHYEQVIKVCRGFLVMSGGSPIPDDFELVKLIKHEPAFVLDNTQCQEEMNAEMRAEMAAEYADYYRDEY